MHVKKKSDLLQNGLAHQQAGRLQEAKTVYQSILKAQPQHPDALHLLGLIAHKSGEYDVAVDLIEKAIKINPTVSEFYNNCGGAYRALRKNDIAITCYEQALAIKPDSAEAHYNLGNALSEKGKMDEAIDHYETSLALQPDDAEVHNNLGIILQELDRREDAIAHYEQALALKPNHIEAHINVGNAFQELGQFEEAIAHYEHALAIQPDDAEVHNNLGSTFLGLDRVEDAITHYEHALAIQPEDTMAHNNLGIVFSKLGLVEVAIASYERALIFQPDYAEAHSNQLFIQNYQIDIHATTLFRAHQRWAQQHAMLLSHNNTTHLNKPEPERRLRIAYLSPDFRQHSVAYFIESIFSAHDHQAYEIFAYHSSIRYDSMSERLQAATDHWRPVIELNDEKLAELIREDSIDILVDLAGHTAHNRMRVLAMKPAPIQISYLGYPNTSGLATMDYRLTDKWADPPGQTEAYHTEELLRLPHGFLCYQPQPGSPDVEELPVVTAGHITFGSFNAYPKINTEVIQVWCRILRALPDARLLMKTRLFRDDGVCKQTRLLFQEQGVSSERLELVSYIPSYNEHLNLYNRVDIALDTFPYNGTTTSCEALWMGVPVVTLAGESHRSRVGVSILNSIGLDELITDNTDAYVTKVLALAGDVEALAKLSATIRDKMQHSPLTDTEQFTRTLEEAYMDIWQKWCAQALGTNAS